MCSKNQVFAGQKRQSVHQEGNNALSSRRRNAISCDPSVGDKVESCHFFLCAAHLQTTTAQNHGFCGSNTAE